MGYAGYAPGNRIADKLTPMQQALRSLPLEKAQESLDLIEKLTRNVVRNPGEDKFRRINLSNPKISAAITDVHFAVDALKEMGWVQDDDALLLPPSVHLAHEREVVGIIDAKDYYKKEVDNERRRQMAARKAVSEEKEALLQQMEADRKEKVADGPVVHSSVAKQFGNGPNIVKASDLGIGNSSGG
mmetsp:Transcript_19128/g.36841  ORF Transcript_19128/g.36841 Transcript_19128/m.36841 type:complete len:186 (-) Transcript_19128:282-839(-)